MAVMVFMQLCFCYELLLTQCFKQITSSQMLKKKASMSALNGHQPQQEINLPFAVSNTA